MTEIVPHPSSPYLPLADVLDQMRQLRSDFAAVKTEMRSEMREERERLWDKIDSLDGRFNDMERQISSGKGMVQALIWVGGGLLTMVATISGLFDMFFKK